jgi:hypothetical protein
MLFENVPWNLSSKRELFRARDCLIVSIPKSGRTWLRVLLHTYYSKLLGSHEPINSQDRFEDGRPAYYFTHDLYEHQTIASPLHRLRGRFLIPPDERRNRILLLARDPRDVMVSLYFQNTRREKASRRYKADISTMLDDPILGVDRVIQVMNHWMQEWGSRDEGFLLARYEDWQADPWAHFSAAIRFMGGIDPDDAALEAAIGESRFDRMQERERQTSDGPRAVRPGDPSDPDSYKARRGKVGGYRDYLSDTDINRIETAMRALDPRFGYTP